MVRWKDFLAFSIVRQQQNLMLQTAYAIFRRVCIGNNRDPNSTSLWGAVFAASSIFGSQPFSSTVAPLLASLNFDKHLGFFSYCYETSVCLSYFVVPNMSFVIESTKFCGSMVCRDGRHDSSRIVAPVINRATYTCEQLALRHATGVKSCTATGELCCWATTHHGNRAGAWSRDRRMRTFVHQQKLTIQPEINGIPIVPCFRSGITKVQSLRPHVLISVDRGIAIRSNNIRTLNAQSLENKSAAVFNPLLTTGLIRLPSSSLGTTRRSRQASLPPHRPGVVCLSG